MNNLKAISKAISVYGKSAKNGTCQYIQVSNGRIEYVTPNYTFSCDTCIPDGKYERDLFIAHYQTDGDVYPSRVEDYENWCDDSSMTRIGSMPAQALWDALNIIIPTMSKSDVRYYLNGALFEFRSRLNSKIISTNGHMLAQNDLCVVLDNPEAELDVILNRDSLLLLQFMLNKSTKGIYINRVKTTYGDAILFSCDTWSIACQIIDGKFPDWRRVYKPHTENSVVVDKKQTIAAIKDRRIIGKANKDRCICIEVSNAGIVPVSDSKAYPAINIDYLEALVASYPYDSIPMYFTDANTSIYIGETGVIMPVRK